MAPHPKWLGEKPHVTRSQTFGDKQEKKTLRAMGARRTPRSGAGSMKGDGRVKVAGLELHIEVKATARKSFPVTRKLMHTLRHQAGTKRTPVLVVKVDGGKEGFVVLPWAAWIKIQEALDGTD